MVSCNLSRLNMNMNIAGVSSQIMHTCNNTNKRARRLFLRELGLALTPEHLQRRALAMNVPPLVRERRKKTDDTSNVQQSQVISIPIAIFAKKSPKQNLIPKNAKNFCV